MQERIQIFTILLLSIENPRLAGSMFPETDRSLAWLCSSPQLRLPLHPPNQCYDQLPILYKGRIHVVDLITKQTLRDAMPQNWWGPIDDFFRRDVDQKDSLYSRTPGITRRDIPAVFAPKDISPFTTPKFPQSANAGMYTKEQLSNFRDAIIMNSASKKGSAEFQRKLDSKERTGWIHILRTTNRLLRR